jgi:ABC-2 type transport system ATP-binding protein
MTSAIETFGLTKRYGSTTAVTDLSLRVEQGQVFGFLGPNGAGKSTTIRMLLALQRPTAGRAVLLGLDAAADSVEVHRRVGYLPGDLELFPRLTGRQHIAWFAHVRGVDADPVARRLADRFQVVVDRPMRELSKGNRQKIGLVLAFMHRPELLVLDEPTSGLDPLMQHEFESLLLETVAEGRTVFLSSHELDEVQRIADRIAIIKSGKLVAEDTVAGLRRAAPQKIEVRFPCAVDPAVLSALKGVTVTGSNGPRVTLDVAGEIAPVLKVIASHDPVELISRPPGLDELFLGFYRDSPQRISPPGRSPQDQSPPGQSPRGEASRAR